MLIIILQGSCRIKWPLTFYDLHQGWAFGLSWITLFSPAKEKRKNDYDFLLKPNEFEKICEQKVRSVIGWTMKKGSSR